MKTPVALIIFNRPDCTARVLESIAQAKPEKLFVIADGPRPNRPEDIDKCAATRAVIERVDWDCEVLTDYSPDNLGCGLRPVTGLDWVFSQVEAAIILEDDCLPQPTFFPFCEELLARYRDDERVMMIGGVNFLGQWKQPEQSYYFSRFGGTWGWASWRRAWRLNDYEMKLWPTVLADGTIEKLFPNPIHAAYWQETFQKVYDGRVRGAWDYQWLLACWINSGYRIFPAVNLISNIGFRDDATHTFGESPLSNMPAAPIEFPLKHPSLMVHSVEADQLIQEFFCPSGAAGNAPQAPVKPAPAAASTASAGQNRQGINGKVARLTAPRASSVVKKLIRPLINNLGYEISRKAEPGETADSPLPAFDREVEAKIHIVHRHTMLPYARLYSLYQQAVYCETAGIAGSFVECGTWKGGAVGLMALANQAYGQAPRHIHLFDSFEGIPEPDETVDGARAVSEARQAGGGSRGQLVPVPGFYESQGTLQANRDLLENIIGYDPDYLHYHQGWFQTTLPRDAGTTGDIAILRLDGDWYASTRVCLEHLFHRVVAGGFIIIDDYGCYEGCRKAVDEFLKQQGLTPFLHRIDSEGRYLVR